jgi:hypothetical protein
VKPLLEDTDLTIFRVYEPHELKDGRYPYAWDHLICPECHGSGEIGFNPTMPRDPQYDETAPCPTCHGEGGLDYGIKDIVRDEAGHRCIRCQHPFKVGETGTYEREPQPDTFCSPPAGISFDGLPEAQAAATYGRGIHWSPCDEQCTHDGPIRWRPADRAGLGESCGWNIDPQAIAPPEGAWEVQAAWRILTVHHLNERKFDCRWHNLVSLCQRCHLTIQRKVEMNQVWPFEHSDWFKPYAAGFYAYSYRGVELTRAEVEKDLDELLSLERVA